MKDLFLLAFDLAADERRRLLDDECGNDASLRARVEELLGYEDDPRDPAAAAREVLAHDEPAPEPLELPESIGGYDVVRVLGAGGMGVVYEAVQSSPRRRVALKVLRPGFAGGSARRRFELEAQLLGRLRHAGIAQVYEARFDDDAPFIAMEYVEGPSLTAWVRERDPTLRDRLRLWARTCDALHHAHLLGVVHRDLKPGNILIDPHGEPKVLDFGVARVLDEELRSTTLRTTMGEVVGTLSYMSPEQASGDPDEVDARSDIYSLGVVGYELVCGVLPRNLSGKLVHEAVVEIREGAVIKPTTRRRGLPRDVETILMTALEHEKGRRYQSAHALGADIRRFLAGEPVEAHPPSRWYQMRMFAKRHRALVVGAVAVVTVLVAGLAATTLYAIRADRASQRAGRAAAREQAAAARQRTATARAEEATYSAQLLAVAAAIEAGRADEARRILAETQETRRGWEWHHFQARLDSCDLLLGEDRLLANGVAFLTGARLATMTRDGELQVRSMASGEVIERTPLAIESPCVAFAASDDGGRVVTAHESGKLASWRRAAGDVSLEDSTRVDMDLGDPHLDLEARGECVVLCSGSRLAFWTPGAGAPRLARRRGRFAALSPDGGRATSNKMRLFDTGSGAEIGFLTGDPEPLTAAAFDRSGSRIAYGSRTPALYLMDVRTGEQIAYLRGRRSRITALAWTGDGTRLISGDSSGQLHVWDVATASLAGTLLGHLRPVGDIVLSDDDRWVAASARGRVRVWDLSRAGTASTIDVGHVVHGVAFSPRGDLLATGDRRGVIRLWDPWSGAPVSTLETRASGGPRGLAWSRDGERLYVSTPATLAIDVVADESPPEAGPADGDLAADMAWPGRLGWSRAPSPGGDLVLTGPRLSAAPLRLTSTSTGSFRRLPTGDGGVFASSFSADGSLLAQAWGGGEVTVVETEGLEVVASLTGHAGAANSVVFSPDGRRLATGGQDRCVRLWDTTTWHQTAVLRGHGGDVQALTFSPDGTRLVSGSHDHTATIWSSLPRRELVARTWAARAAAEACMENLGADGLVGAWRRERSTAARRALLEARNVPRRAASSARRLITGEPGSDLGQALAILHESDGHPRIAIGAPWRLPHRRGEVVVVSLDGNVLRKLGGLAPGDRFGAALQRVPDVDGDGHDDLAIGSPGLDGASGPRCGAVLLVSGSSGAELARIEGSAAESGLGSLLVMGGDYDGDGRRELVAAGRGEHLRVRALSLPALEDVGTWTVARPGLPPFLPLADVDADGIDDVALVDGVDGISIRSGRDDRLLGRIPAPRATVLSAAALPDRDGDGLPDFVLGGQGAGSSRRVARGVGLFGSSGETIWSIPVRPTRPATRGPRLRRLADFTGDGVFEVGVWTSARRRRRTQPWPFFTVLDGATGEPIATLATPRGARDAYGVATRFLRAGDDGRWAVVIGAPDDDPPRVEIHDEVDFTRPVR